MLLPSDFFDLSRFEHKRLFEGLQFVWDCLKIFPDYLKNNLRPGINSKITDGVYLQGHDIFIGENTTIEPGTVIKGPAIIGNNVEIRSCAYIRGNVIVGNNCVIGHASEIKNSIMIDGSNAPHFNYLGDSVLGNNVNLGAGTILSNYKISIDKSIKIKINNKLYDTGLIKLGAIMGDNSGTGCNAVLNPGTLVGKRSLIYPLASAHGYIPPDTVVKLRQDIEIKKLR
ncbi:MAG: glucose-1-phosphate thymidylyltransferase [Candidatus Schekmanbacteria bacterium RIFCSPLOWO2_02_FULL_38_14]|uniref:Glucose-1-phosphate thymidylyltransferase n=1 Tax=Candidatus Schekmanbacteria bacterium RIFCSPLOWO2_12_FULL_38_15 TaxID=1817883 RepID=A0A1F7SI38_9BACT|nr:MAG: glucose-1-phosphate thymidylyltransferase [Candidatus Schekmanbacteria bacterium RIFCSPLOWO2_02_FULL_38_14]OGL53456.1 MAG: glucose-1-phosphate thymidylyltransferase [Candidatus Schekmanbacteria bacterium RIFCSPLOWO2_12_FULL_38_15]